MKGVLHHEKRLASLFLALALCLGLCVPALAFTDVPGDHYAYAAIIDCSERGIVGGYSDGTFQPGKTVTKSHFCAMLARAFYPDQIAKYDTDFIKQNFATFGPTTQTLANNKILKGTSFQYSPSDTSIMGVGINRYDMAQMMANILTRRGFSVSESEQAAAAAKITDYRNVPEQYRAAVASVYALGMIGGYSDGAFHGEGVMNRGQAAAVIYRMIQLCGNAPETPPETEKPETAEKPETPVQPAGQVLSNGKPATVENVTEIMNQLRVQYPDGTDAGAYGSGNKGAIGRVVRSYTNDNGDNRTSTTRACGGWAARVFDAIWGYDVTLRRVTGEDNGYYNARIGDLVIIVNEQGQLTHVAVVCALEYDDLLGFDVVFTTDANYGAGANVMAWDHARYLSTQSTESISISDGGHTPHFYTAYPD